MKENLKKSKKPLQKLINNAKGELKNFTQSIWIHQRIARNSNIDSTKSKTVNAKTLLNHYKQDKINTCSLIRKYQIHLKKHT